MKVKPRLPDTYTSPLDGQGRSINKGVPGSIHVADLFRYRSRRQHESCAAVQYPASAGLWTSTRGETTIRLKSKSGIQITNGNTLTEIQLMTNQHFNYHMVHHEII
jgi:hypothetical protein